MEDFAGKLLGLLGHISQLNRVIRHRLVARLGHVLNNGDDEEEYNLVS